VHSFSVLENDLHYRFLAKRAVITDSNIRSICTRRGRLRLGVYEVSTRRRYGFMLEHNETQLARVHERQIFRAGL